MGKNGKNIENFFGLAVRRVSRERENEILLVEGKSGLRFPRVEVSEGYGKEFVREKLRKYFCRISGVKNTRISRDYENLFPGENPVKLYRVGAYGDGITSEGAKWVTLTDGILDGKRGLEERTRRIIKAFREGDYL